MKFNIGEETIEYTRAEKIGRKITLYDAGDNEVACFNGVNDLSAFSDLDYTEEKSKKELSDELKIVQNYLTQLQGEVTALKNGKEVSK